MTPGPQNLQKRWLDDRRNVTKIFFALVACCAALLLVDAFRDRHGHFAWENWFGFFGFYGFFGSVFLVLTAKALRRVLGRREDYYDE